MYLDTNKLYGQAELQPLPTSSFKWLIDEERKELDVMMVPGDSSRGYIVESDSGKYYFYYYMSMYISYSVMFYSY